MSEQAPPRDARLTFVGSLIAGVFKALMWGVAAVIVSVLIEWVGIVFLWPDEGVLHSERMLAQERVYLASAANSIPLLHDKSGYIEGAQAWIAVAEKWTGLQFIQHLQIGLFADYVTAALNILGVFISRLFVLFLATPAFVVFGAVGLVRGLVAREIRKWSGGRESSGVYHLALRLLPDVTLGLWVVYLAIPVSINPFWIVGPVVVSFSVVLSQLAYRFKKYV